MLIPIKVVIAMFGADTGDEFHTWVDQLPLLGKLPFPQC
jgi:hypothetical protein